MAGGFSGSSVMTLAVPNASSDTPAAFASSVCERIQ
jgi:hypothetical protein